jgi:hypothetical protein
MNYLTYFFEFSTFSCFLRWWLRDALGFNKFSMDDLLNVDEREQAIGFHISITTMLRTFEGACR